MLTEVGALWLNTLSTNTEVAVLQKMFPAGDGVNGNGLLAGPPSMNPQSQMNRTAQE